MDNKDPKEDLVLVHADGGDCHGVALVNGKCPKCGIVPDMQSTEFWPPSKVKQMGFTLMEIIIAIFMLAVFGILIFVGYHFISKYW